MRRPFLASSLLLASALYACSSDDAAKPTIDDAPTAGTSGSNQAGTGASAGSGTGGNSTGGTGGNSTGGNSTGGNSTGGNSTGGNSTGGTGGNGTGGTGTGGTGTGGNTGGSGATGGAAGSSAGGDAGAAGDPGQGGAAGDAGAGGAIDIVGGGAGVGGSSGSSGSGGAIGPDPTPLCKPGFPWNPDPKQNQPVLPKNQFGEKQEDRVLAAISPDALTLVWSTQTGMYFADRAAPSDAFSTYNTLPASLSASGYPALDRAALGADRLRLIMVNSERKRLGEIKRLNPGESFSDAVTEEPFKAINDALKADEYLADPLLSDGDKALYYAVFKGDNSSQIRVATRGALDKPWAVQGPLGLDAADSPVGPRKRLHWVSPDQLTFFVFDPATKKSSAFWRKNLGKPVDSSLVIGDIDTPVSAPTCVDLYYSAPNAQNGGLLEIFLIKAI